MDKPVKKKKKYKKLLKCFEVSQEIFQNILNIMNDYVEDVNSLEKLRYGYTPRKKIYKYGKMICIPAMVLNQILGYKVLTDIPYMWYQVCVTVGGSNELNKVHSIISGTQAKRIFTNKMLSVLSKEEFENRLTSYHVEYNEKLAQQHSQAFRMNKILHFPNCYYYDINCAHGDALLEIFPEGKDIIMDMYKHRKDNDGRNKQIFNFFVGMLAHDGIHRGTYNYIVQRTTKKLLAFYDKVGGDKVYVNTDGIILANCKHPVPSSDKIGEFKMKRGDVYVYRCAKYEIFQIYYSDGTNEVKGHLPNILKPKIDLKNGKVVKYKTMVEGHKHIYLDVQEVIL